MDIERLRLYLVGVFVAFCALGWLFLQYYSRHPGPMRPPGEAAMPRADYTEVSAPGWPDTIDGLIASDPDKALDLFRKGLAPGADPTARGRIAAKMPRALKEAYRKRVREERYAEAEKLLGELQASYRGSQEQAEAAKDWHAVLLQRAKKAAATVDWALAERLTTESLSDSDDGVSSQRDTWELLARHRLDLWRKASEAGDPAAGEEHLLAAANVFAGSVGDDLVTEALYERMKLDALVGRGAVWTALGKHSAAVAAFKAALRAAREAGTRERVDEIGPRLDAARLALSRERRAGRFPWLGLEEAERMVQQVASDAEGRTEGAPEAVLAERREAALEAHRELVEVRGVRFDRMLAAGDFTGAESVARRALQGDAAKILVYRARQPGFDAFAGAPPELLERIEKEHPGADGWARVEALGKLVEEGAFSLRLSETESLRSRLGDLYGRWCLSLLGSQGQGERERAYQLARTVLRLYPDGPPAAQVAEQLRAALRQAASGKDFDRLVELAGLYVGEVGAAGVRGAFGAELRGFLQEAAEHFRSSSPMKRLFLLTLTSDAFPVERAGIEAGEEATRTALDIISQSQPQQMAAPQGALPSTVPEHSVECIENGTSHHLLAFFVGPENFFVRVGPERRGTVVLRNGRYTTAVVVTQEDVRPYRGEKAFASQTLKSRYYIAHSSGSSGGEGLSWPSAAGGDYTLLRAPRTLASLKVDPRTCLAFAR